MSVQFKKYRLVKSEKFDDFLKAMGVSYLARKMANNVTFTVQLVKEGENSYSFHTVSSFKTQVMKFKLGEEFEEERLDGKKMRCVITFEGNKMIQQQTGDDGIKFVREFTEDELITTCSFGDVVGYRWFNAVE